jgi:DNA helicase-2/ATP-dependent DNA helicase PcrA
MSWSDTTPAPNVAGTHSYQPEIHLACLIFRGTTVAEQPVNLAPKAVVHGFGKRALNSSGGDGRYMLSAPEQLTLSPEQQKVVSYRGGHLQVIACAGSGKTEAMAHRVATLISEGAAPSQIVAFTFTERAAASLKARIFKRIAARMGLEYLDRLGPMYVGTIHSYCFRLVQDNAPQFANFDILDEHRLAGLLSREHRRLGLERIGNAHWAPIREFVRNADVVTNELINPSRLLGTSFGDCYRDFCAMLARYRFFTYGQLITTAIDALRDQSIYERVHSNLRHLIVDEYQDVNPAQERLIELLAQPPVHLCVVGDDDQSIFQWRGSNVTNIQSFQKRYDAKSLPLSVNRRSRPKIIDAANEFAQTIKPRLQKQMEPSRSSAGPEITTWAAGTEESQAESIADTVVQLRKKGYRYGDIAVLLRSVRTSSPPIIEAFRQRDIPFRCAGRTGLFLQPEAQALGKVYAFLSNNAWKSERYSRQQIVIRLSSLVAEFRALFQLSSAAAGRLEERLKEWQRAAQGDEPANLVGDYYRLLRTLAVHKWDLKNETTAARMGCLARFSELLTDFEHVTRRGRWVEDGGERTFRGGQNRGHWYYRRLFNYIQYYALDAYEDFAGEDTPDLDAVDILTIHQAKGLEWSVVFIPCLVQSRFPSKYAGQPENWLIPDSIFRPSARRRYEGSVTDERRLFYVAMTRSKDQAYLSYFQRRTNSFQPSDFLSEVANGIPTVINKLPLPPAPTNSERDAQEKVAFSFSELASYESCPHSYRLSDLLGFQPQLAPELGYGKAIHHILRRIADFVRTNDRLPTTAEVTAILDGEFYLPFASKPAYEQIRRAADKLVDRYLAKYKQDLFRIWETERAFELHLPEAAVNGRADVILDREGGVVSAMALVDYKTATDMEANDIYAFQLAIYAAAGRGEGINVQAAYIHDLAEGERILVPIDGAQINLARDRASNLVNGLLARDFVARPEVKKCRRCDVRLVCPHGSGS